MNPIVRYPLDGITQEWLIPFEYLARRFIVVTLIGNAGNANRVLDMTVDYRFPDKKVLRLNDVWGIGDGYNAVEFRRVTSVTQRLVSFNDGSVLAAAGLNIAYVQSLHIAEEARYGASTALSIEGGSWDAKGSRIVNVGDPVGDQDAAHKSWVERITQGIYDKSVAYTDRVLAGVAGGIAWFKQIGAGAVERTVQDKLRDVQSPRDHGAVGDGVTNDTASFEAFEADHRNKEINLGGMTFMTDRDFRNNRYVNGKLLVNGTLITKEEEAIKSEVQRADYNYNSALRYDIQSIYGNTVSRGAQSFCFEERTRSLYLMEGGKLARFDMDGPIKCSMLDGSSEPSPYIGHQGLAVEYLPSGVKFWSTSALGGRYAYRFDYVPNAPLPPGDNYQLFDGGNKFANAASCTPTVSSCGLYVVAHGVRWGSLTSVIRVFELKTLIEGGSGDYSDKFLYEWETQGLLRDGNPLQGTACDGVNVYLFAGGTGFGTDTRKRLYTYSLKGVLISKEDNLRVGRTLAQGDGSGVKYEPEGLSIMQGPTGATLMIGILSGDASARRFRIFGTGLSVPVLAKTLYLIGNGLGSISSATTAGREYMAIRAVEGLEGGSGMNLYGNNDSSNPGGWGLFTAQKSRLTFTANGAAVHTADIGVTPLTSRMDGSGQVQSWERGSLKVGGMNISTLNMTLFTNAGLDLMFGAGQAGADWRIQNASKAFHPQVDGVQNIGTATVKIDTLFAKNPTISTSDQREKTPVRPLSDAERAVGLALAERIGSWEWLSEVYGEKGESARTHIGPTVQDAMAAFEAEGRKPFSYASVCHDVWPEKTERVSDPVLDAEGVEVEPAKYVTTPAGDRYSFRNDEVQYLILGALAAEIRELKEKLKEV